jgi:hypothetical protein
VSVRPPLAVLNDLSLPTPGDRIDAAAGRELLGTLVDTLRAARRIRTDLALTSHVPVATIPITASGEGFATLAQGAGGVHRDRWRYLQALRNHAPFSVAPDLATVDLGESYRHEGIDCTGLGLAASAGQLAVSLATHDGWNVHRIELEHCTLVETDDGDVIEEKCTTHAAHASQVAHVELLRDHIADLALPSPFTGADLWDDRLERYPNLHLLARVEAQLRSFAGGYTAFRQEHLTLQGLDQAVAEWNPDDQRFPSWRTKVTPEGETRKRQCRFYDDNGVSRCFDLHARFTPGAGRIHFCLMREEDERRLWVGHIGPKL